jgi:hypothetical protein
MRLGAVVRTSMEISAFADENHEDEAGTFGRQHAPTPSLLTGKIIPPRSASASRPTSCPSPLIPCYPTGARFSATAIKRMDSGRANTPPCTA